MKTKNLFLRLGQFFKRNAYYVVLFACIAGIATMITIAALSGGSTPPKTDIIDNNNTPPPAGGDTDVDTDPVKFILPVADFELGMEFTDSTFVKYETIRMWKTHPALDFIADEGTDVMAVFDGVVQSITSNPNDGTVITIKHNDELTTVYKSITANPQLKSGDKVKKGDVIAYVANNYLKEFDHGPHLHLELLLNGTLSDPAAYFDLALDK